MEEFTKMNRFGNQGLDFSRYLQKIIIKSH